CLGFFIIGIGSAAHQAPPALVGLELGAALLLGWIMTRRDADHPAPMLPIDLFRRPMFALSAATSVCSFAVQGLAFVSLPFYFEDVLHRSQVETGFFMTPWPLVVAIMAPIGGRLSDRYPVGILGGLGLVLLGIGMALLATLPPDPGIANIVWRTVVCGMGFGFFQPPSMLAVACLLLFPATLQAQTVWDMPTEYPQNAMPGVGLTAFTKHVAESSAGKLEIRPSFDAKAGIKSAGMLTAVAEGRVQAGDAFAGALEAGDPIFALP